MVTFRQVAFERAGAHVPFVLASKEMQTRTPADLGFRFKFEASGLGFWGLGP